MPDFFLFPGGELYLGVPCDVDFPLQCDPDAQFLWLKREE